MKKTTSFSNYLKLFLASLLFLNLPNTKTSKAQTNYKIGVYLEPKLNLFSEQETNTSLKLNNGTSFSIGGVYEYAANDWFSMRGYLGYTSQKSFEGEWTNLFQEPMSDELKTNGFLDFALTTKYNPIKLNEESIIPYFEIGAGYSARFGSESKSVLFLDNGKDAWGSGVFATMAIGSTFNFENNMSLDIAATFRPYLGAFIKADYEYTPMNSDRPEPYNFDANLSQIGVRAILFFGNNKKSKPEAKMPQGEVRVDVLCGGPEYFSTYEYFRANAVAESSNQANSRRMALSNARLDLSGQIETRMKVVIDNYFQDMNVGDKQEFVGRYEGLSREVINQKLNGTKIICEELTMTPAGRYKTYLAIELMGADVFKAINDRINSDDRLRTNYEYERFREEFNKEMEKMR